MAENFEDQTDNWSRGQTLQLIREYQKYPCLYSPLDKNFVNKVNRNEKYNLILIILHECKPTVTVKSIKSKIRTLQSQLWKEKQNILKSRRSGSGSDEYEPKLWCYNELTILHHCNDAEPSTSNIDLSHIGIEDSETSQETNIENNTKKKRKTTKASMSQQLQADSLQTLEMAKKFMESRSERKPLTKEEVFCTYLCSELKKIMLEETFANLKLEILQLVNKKLFEEKRIFQDQNYFNPIFDHQPVTHINQPIPSSTPISKNFQFSITSDSPINYPQKIKPASCNFIPLSTTSNFRSSIPSPSSPNLPYSTTSTLPIDYLQTTNRSSNFTPISSSPQYSPLSEEKSAKNLKIPSHIGSHIHTTISSPLSISSPSKTTSASSINNPQKTKTILSKFIPISNSPTYLSSAVPTYAQKIKIPSYIKSHPSTSNSSPLVLSSLCSTTSASPINCPQITKPIILRSILIKGANKQPTPTKDTLQLATDGVLEDFFIED